MEKRWERKDVLVRSRRRLLRIHWPILAVLWMLALGIGVNAGVFTVGSLVFPYLPYPNPEQLIVLRPAFHDGSTGMSSEDFIRFREETTVFQNLSASTARGFRLSTSAGLREITVSLVTAGFFRIMGDRFYLGKDFDSRDLAVGNDRVAILSHPMWEQLGANKFVVGSTVSLDGTRYTVVGVLAAGLRDRGAGVTIPLNLTSRYQVSDPQRVNVIGRLRTGISIPQAQSDVDMALARISRGDLDLAVGPVGGASLHNDRKFTIWLVLGLVAFLMLMECVSVVGLFRLRSEAVLKKDLELFGEF